MTAGRGFGLVWLGTDSMLKGSMSKEAQQGEDWRHIMENINWPIFPFGCNIGPYRRRVGSKTESSGPSIPAQEF